MNEEYRYEIKFVLSEYELLESFRFLKSINAFKPYPDRDVNSLYFDTIDFQCVKDNLSGISDRHKVRLRWYDDIDNNVFLEIKKRVGRLGSKDKYSIKNLSKRKILEYNIDEINKKVFNYFHKNYQFNNLLNEYYIPILFVNYRREYYESDIFISNEHKTDRLRVTIDKKINFRNISLNFPIKHYNEVIYNEYIMEIKFPIYMKDEVSRILKSFSLTPKRHSKYLTGMAKLGYVTYI
ncbi:MAG: Unknown protein [uncultured Sulfurovum sp.]|uniref:VTC domain-containing protein n=1 Tax=uncultured Sulfurovum sp. TaxID=269237 RepID=A0A6S6T9P8_9BACT|nr:MAG: Unknown protein [uncultured Sulfurovum sp.]